MMRMMSSLMLLILSSHMMFEGIIPALLVKILLLKGTILLGPPITLGAFVIGHGSGLLVARLQEIHSRWFVRRRPHRFRGWGRPPKRPRLQHRLRWILKNLFHRGWKEGHPPMFPRPPEHYIKHYDYESHHPNAPPQVYHSLPKTVSYKHFPSIENPHLHTEHHHEPNPEIIEFKSYKHSNIPHNLEEGYNDFHGLRGTGGYDEESHSSEFSDSSNEYPEDSIQQAESELKQILSLYAKKDKIKDQTPLEALTEKLVIEELLKPKQSVGSKGDDTTQLLEKLLERQFAIEAMESTLKTDKRIPEFIPFPVDTAKAIDNSNATTIEPEKNEATEKTKNILSPVWNMFTNFDPTDYISDNVMKWLMEPSSRDSTKRRKRGIETVNKVSEADEVTELTSSFMKDVRNLFSIVSFLDISQCLEKMVCQVHTREYDPKVTSYESNLVSAFRVMDAIMPLSDSPPETDDSSIKYRKAAKLGEVTRSSEVCKSTFPTCSMDASRVISLGNIAASAVGIGGNVDVRSESE